MHSICAYTPFLSISLSRGCAKGVRCVRGNLPHIQSYKPTLQVQFQDLAKIRCPLAGEIETQKE